MIGAARAHRAQLGGPRRPGKRQRVRRAVPVRDDAPRRRHGAAQARQNCAATASRSIRGVRRRGAAKRLSSGSARVLLDELAHLVDRPDAVRVAVALRVAPGEQPVAAEEDPVASRVLLDRAANHQRQLEARPLPRHPDDAPAVARVELLEFPRAVRARRERDRPVGMQMIDVRKRQERVQRRVDRRRHAVVAERAQRIEADHLVFVRFTAIARHEVLQLVEVKQRKSAARDRSQVAAAPLDGHHAGRLPGQRIGQIEFSSSCCRRRSS